MLVNGTHYRTVWLDGTAVKAIDQHRLPHRFEVATLATYRDTADAIRTMLVRGAGAIGVAAGFGMAQATLAAPDGARFRPFVEEAAALFKATRPTAQNLFYAVDRLLAAVKLLNDRPASARHRAVEVAQAIADEDAAAGERIGQIGEPLIPEKGRVMTHCNAGWLAFADWGTALAPIYVAARKGRPLFVYVNETRPRGQGAKLTAWELAQEGVPHALIADVAAGSFMQRGEVDLIIVGADRIAANGDVANKIGTFTLAVLAREHRIPFYVAAPCSTIDPACSAGSQIPIEERSVEEVVTATGLADNGREVTVRLAPAGCPVRNPAFDVTPAAYISGIITERGMAPATTDGIRRICAGL